MKITSMHNDLVKFWVSLKNKKVRDKERKFIVEGDHLIDEARKNILNGTCKIFEGKIETNDGQTAGESGKAFDDDEIINKINWYYKNVVVC